MFNPKHIDRLLGISAFFAAIIVAIFQIPSGFTELNKFLFRETLLPNLTIISLFAIPLFCLFYMMNTIIFNQKEEHKTTLLRLDNAEKLLDDTKRQILTDIITGIPNQLKWKEDIERISSKANSKSFYVILIDLENFGEINKKYGFSKGDEVIRTIALSIYDSMRRNEEIYKHNPAAEVAGKSLLGKMYRRYSAGDEFLFLVQGTEDDALGFIWRQNKLLEEMKPRLDAILGEARPFRFYAAVDKVRKGDSEKTILCRIEPMYQKAKEHYKDLRIYFPSLVNPEEAGKLSNFDRVMKTFRA